MPRAELSRIPGWYHGYINQVKENDLESALTNNTSAALDFLSKIPAEKHDFRYAEGKWTVKEVFQHVIDAERVFGYRALCIARRDQTPLPSFDEDSYAKNSNAGNRKWADMLAEFKSLRESNERMFRSFDAEQLESTGNASGNSIYVLGIGFILVGHVTHHLNVIRERYL